jgi:hypothetical protein
VYSPAEDLLTAVAISSLKGGINFQKAAFLKGGNGERDAAGMEYFLKFFFCSCRDFLEFASNFYQVPHCGIRVLAAAPASSARKLGQRTVRRLPSGDHANPGLDANSCKERGDLIRNFCKHTVPRVLPSPRLSTIPIS